jgi:Phosphotransferase enzyme family
MPQLARFMDQAMQLAPDLLGGPAAGPPRLIRYRPGLSATFRWAATDGRVVYVKQTPTEDVAAHAATVTRLIAISEGQGLRFTPVTGMIPDLGLIAYAAADGTALDHDLAGSGAARIEASISQIARALARLSELPVSPARSLDRGYLLRRADAAMHMIALLDPVAGNTAARLVAGLHAHDVPVRNRPIHADMKLEHAFLSGPRTTLIDIESLSMGDPDYDLAALQARLEMATLAGGITGDEADAATSALRPFTGPHYPWFLTCARLQCAKFFAQRFDPATIPLMRRMLAPC